MNKKIYMKKWRTKHKKQICQTKKTWQKKNKNKIKLYNKKYKEQHKEQLKKYRMIHKDEISQRAKKWRQEHKEQDRENRKKWRKKNENKMQKYYLNQKEYLKNYRKKHKKEMNKNLKNRRKNDINFRLKCNLQKRIWETLKGNPKLSTTIKLVGCSIKQFKHWIEKKFKFGMSWENYGGGWNGRGMQEWHIDHIKPCCKFDLSNPKEQKKCFHYTNLQPLWAEENLKKGKKRWKSY
ncbi:MAG: hypothetical protein V1901_04095 [Patescibacteria group bacterium]